MPRIATTTRLRLAAACIFIGLSAAACGTAPDGQSRIGSRDAASQESTPASAQRLSPTEGLDGGVTGGQEPGSASGSGTGDLSAGLSSASGGSAPQDGSTSFAFDGLPGAAQAAALVAGTLQSTYTVDYEVSPTLMADMVVANSPGKQSIHSFAVNGVERWTLYENNEMTIDCDNPQWRGWWCRRVIPQSERTKKDPVVLPFSLTADLQQLIVGISSVQLTPGLVLALLAPPLQGSGGVASSSYTASIAGAPASCLQYTQSGRPPAEVCANGDAVPVKLATHVTTIDIVFLAKSYTRGVAADAFTPPAPL